LGAEARLLAASRRPRLLVEEELTAVVPAVELVEEERCAEGGEVDAQRVDAHACATEEVRQVDGLGAKVVKR